MNWLTNFGLFLVLTLVLHGSVEGKKKHHSGNSSKTPWTNPEKAQAFMNCLIQKIGTSSVFPQQEKEDMEQIVKAMMKVFSSMDSSGDSNAAKMQAMNMAFASSMAEIVIAEDANDPDSISVKTNALEKALKQCFKSTIGSVNKHFIAEIKDLIVMFAKEAAANDEEDESEGEDYDVPQKGISAGADMPDVSFQMEGMDVSAGAPGADIDMYGSVPGMQARVGAPQRFGSALKLGFGKSKLFNACFNTKTSPRNAARLANIVIGKMASDQKWDRDTAAKVKNASVKALMGVPQGSDTNVYANVLSDALSTELGSSGQINDDNLNQMGPDMAGNFLLGVSGTAPKMGMQLGGIDINSDLSNLRTQMSSSMRAPGMDVSAGMPGMDVGAEMPGTDVSAEMPGMDVSAGMPGMDVSAGMPGMDVGAEMPGMDVSAGMPGMDVSAGMPGVDATAGIPGLGKLLDSTGLKSPQALNRITGLASGLLQAVGPNGINVGKLAGMLQGNINNLVKTGVSKGEATVETVVELMASTLQLLKSVPLLGNVDLSSLTKDLSSTTKAVSSVVSLLANI